MRLYYRSDCPFCWKVRIALHELSVPYEVVRIHLGETHPDVLRLNPNKTIPVLVIDDLVLWESNTILEYLEERFGPRLLAGEPAARARARTLVDYADTIVGPALRGLVFEKRAKPKAAWDRKVIADSERRWRASLRYLETALDGRMWFGDAVGFAECALIPRFGLAEHYGVGVDSAQPNLLRWYTAFKTRPSFRATVPWVQACEDRI